MYHSVLGRDEYEIASLQAKFFGRVLITGAAGSVGRALLRRIPAAITTDIVLPADFLLDLKDTEAVAGLIEREHPDVIVHLAGAKHAPDGEDDAYLYTRTNVSATHNLLVAAKENGVDRFVFASTCKACDPETVYGATKLIAERMVLAQGGSVARFHNVIEAGGNVFRTWETTDPMLVADADRRLITMNEATGLIQHVASTADPGRYCVGPLDSRSMSNVARLAHPTKRQKFMPRRKGDRKVEPFVAKSESWKAVEHNQFGVCQVVSPHDPV